jgi:TolB protein
MIRVALLATFVACAGCTGVIQLEPDPLGDLVQLVVTPKASELVIHDLSQPPAQVAFRAIGVFSDGARRDVTQQIVWTVDNPLPGGFLDPGVFTTTNQAAGEVGIVAMADQVWATSEVTVRIDATIVDGAFPPSDPTLFDNAKPVILGDPLRSPQLLYPSDSTWFPQHLPNTVFQLARGDQNDAFQLSFDTDLMHLAVITGADRWETGAVQNLIAQSNMGDLVTVSIEAASSADPGTIYQGPSIGVRYSSDSPDGPLYFWSAATNGIMRGDIGASFAGKLYPGDATCVGCHTVSRDGARMAMGWGGETVSALQTIDVQSLSTTISQSKLYEMGWATYSPDGSLLLIASNGVLVLRDATTGLPINSPTGKVALPVGHYATHPEWSPDGKYVAIAYTATQPSNIDVKAASIARLAFDPITHMFSGPEILVPATAVDNYYFPKYSPDGAYLAYVHATEASHGAASAELALIGANGGTTTSLAAASHTVASLPGTPGTATQMPTWAPFQGQFAWLAFTSARPYGVVLPSGGRSQLWVSAIDLGHEIAGVDPSAAGFWLPCQDPTVVNNTPIWAPAAVQPQ